jgi:ankyrin repeat protein
LQYTPLCGNWIRISYIRLSRVVFLEACFYGNLEIVKVLVENGANVNGNQNDQRSPGKKKDQGYPISLILKQVYYQGKKRLYNMISLGMRRERKKRTFIYYLTNLIEKKKMFLFKSRSKS